MSLLTNVKEEIARLSPDQRMDVARAAVAIRRIVLQEGVAGKIAAVMVTGELVESESALDPEKVRKLLQIGLEPATEEPAEAPQS